MSSGKRLLQELNRGWAMRFGRILRSSDRRIEDIAEDSHRIGPGISTSQLYAYGEGMGTIVPACRMQQIIAAAGSAKVELAEHVVGAPVSGVVVTPAVVTPIAFDAHAALSHMCATSAELAADLSDGRLDHQERARLRPMLVEAQRRIQSVLLEIGEGGQA